jgi:hypothetical protein
MSSTETPAGGSTTGIHLPRYATDPDSGNRRAARIAILAVVTVFCFFYGLMFAAFAPGLLLPLLAPVVLLAGLVVWALPVARTAPTRSVEALFFAFLIALVAWPNYLALSLPGLPWITMQRLAGGPLVLLFLICVSTSKSFRDELGAVLRAAPAVWRLVTAFAVITLISIAFSHNKGASIDKFVTAQLTWTAIFFIACFVFSRPGRVDLWAKAIWILALAVGAVAIYERHIRQIPWAGHIPGFLAIEDPNVAAILDPMSSVRSFSNIYRPRSTFVDSIGLAEYNTLVFPFLFHFAIQPYKLTTRFAAALTIPFLLYVTLLTNARSGILGFLISGMLYALYWGCVQWRTRRESYVGPLLVMAYPVFGAVLFGATFVVGRLHKAVWGSGAQVASTAARKIQVRLGIPKILHNPFGYGIGQGAPTLGFHAPDGTLTIDNYWLAVALEYGVIGFLVFYGMFIFAGYLAAYDAVFSDGHSRETTFLAPAAISLAGFVVVKAVYSEMGNHPIAFMILGMIVALLYRSHQRTAGKLETKTVAVSRNSG